MRHYFIAVHDNGTLTVSEDGVNVFPEGSFASDVKVGREGESLVLRASTQDGRKAERHIPVPKAPPKGTPAPLPPHSTGHPAPSLSKGAQHAAEWFKGRVSGR